MLIQHGDNFAFTLDNLLTATLFLHLSSALQPVTVLLLEWQRRVNALESKIMTRVDFHLFLKLQATKDELCLILSFSYLKH